MFEMDLDDVRRVAPVRKHRWLEGNRTDWRIAPPIRIAFAPLARSDAKIVKRIAPAAFALESQMRGIEAIGLNRAHRIPPGPVEMISRPVESDGHNVPQIVLIDPDLLLRVFKDTLQLALFLGDLFEADALIVVHLRACAGQALGVALCLDGLGNLCSRSLTDSALRQPLCHTVFNHLPHRAELIPDLLSLAHKRIKNDVRFTLLIFEV